VFPLPFQSHILGVHQLTTAASSWIPQYLIGKGKKGLKGEGKGGREGGKEGPWEGGGKEGDGGGKREVGKEGVGEGHSVLRM